MATMAPDPDRSRRLVLATLLMAALAVPRPAAAFRDCCFARSIPPRLAGIAFNGSLDQSLDRLEHVGFGDYDPVNRRIPGLGILVETGPQETVPAGPGRPAITLIAPQTITWELACGPSHPFTPMPMGGHPNGAHQLRAVIAVVDDLDRACTELGSQRAGAWGISFGPAVDDPDLGARVREARLEFGSLRLIAPVDSTGVAARWLAHGGPRWIGFEVEVGDLVATEQWLGREQVGFRRDVARGETVLRIDPADLDGLLVEFVQHGRF
jgi:hypothetical protein